MKRHWLGGVLFGVSLVLLLAGGVAMTQGSLSVEKGCIGCVPFDEYWGGPTGDIPYGPYGVTVTLCWQNHGGCSAPKTTS